MDYDFKLIKSGVPIYHQLKEQIKLGIATGKLEPGSQLPTVRQLAVQLEINANTVSRVYNELEAEGYLLSQQGKGTFVANRVRKKDAAALTKFEELVEELVVEAHKLGFTVDDILTYLHQKIVKGG